MLRTTTLTLLEIKRFQNHCKHWTDAELQKLRELARANTPTRVIVHKTKGWGK